MVTTDFIAPQSLADEEAVLGACMIRADVLDRVAKVLRPEDFYRPSNRVIYRAMLSLHDKGMGVDQLTVIDALKDSGRLEQAGGAVEVTNLIEACPSTANVDHYAKTVKELAECRKWQEVGWNIVEKAQNPVELDRYKRVAEDFINAHSAPEGVAKYRGKSLIADVLAQIEAPGAESDIFPYPFAQLQEVTQGYRRQQVITISGYQGDGKSLLAQMFAVKGAMAGYRVDIYSLEMSREEYGLRILTTLTGVSEKLIRHKHRRTLEQSALIAEAQALTETWDWDLHVGSGSTLTMGYVRREQSQRHADILIIDHVHEMDSDNDEVSRNVMAAHQIARDLDCAVILLCQLRKPMDGTFGRPNMLMLRGSSKFADVSHAILFLYRKRGVGGDLLNHGEVIIGKLRGAQGGFSVPVRLDTDRLCFREIAA